MGLLDEAIREHLDLKRRRGADPGDIERAEREALGPVRREPFEPEADEFELARGGDAYDHEEELDDHQRHAEAPLGDERDWGDAFEEETEFAGAEAPDEARGLDDATRVMGSTPFEDEFAVEDPPPPHPAGPVGDETVQYDIDEAIAAEDREPGSELEPEAEPESQPGPEKQHGEDVLEETPDFLQDTPDHDRLWFEQRPPRDFDFDD